MEKKAFKDTKLGMLLIGAASLLNPTLGGVLQGALTPGDAIKAIGESGIPAADKIKLQQMLYDHQNTELQEVTKRWQADQMSDSWLSKNIRPIVLASCMGIFLILGVLDSIDKVGVSIHEAWISTFETMMMSVVGAYFGGRSIEKSMNIYKNRK